MKTSALSTALGLFPSVIKSGEHWSAGTPGSCQSVLEEAQAELAAIRASQEVTQDPAKPGITYEDIGAALCHSVNFHSIDGRLNMSDIAIVALLLPELTRHLRGETDVQVYEAMTPQERAEAFSPEALGA